MINNLLDELTQLYDDFDKETNFWRKYANLIQEKSKFNDFYLMFQRLFFYLEYHEKQLIINLRDKIIYHLCAAWSSQLIQSESLNEIRDYLIHLNNEQQVMNDIKKKKSLNKVRKQIIFADEHSKLFYRKIEVIVSVNQLKSRDATLTSVKNLNVQAEICFTCHKLSHISRECSDWLFKVNALNDENEFNRSSSDSDSNSKN